MIKKFCALVLPLSMATLAQAQQSTIESATVGAGSTYETVLAGKICSDGPEQTITCQYKVGNDLHFKITEVGEPAAEVTFFKSLYEGDFYASFSFTHNCVEIKRGLKAVAQNPVTTGEDAEETPITAQPVADEAYVSLRSGKVYKDWRECRSVR
ncbi:MAG: hypothetical protein ACREUA_09835 [Burkholderiales bacterium]